MKVKKKNLRITMPDGSQWDVPIKLIARHRASYYAKVFGEDLERNLKEDTWPLFEMEDGDYSIHDWAASNMDWDDVKKYAVQVSVGECDYQEGWLNGDYEVI